MPPTISVIIPVHNGERDLLDLWSCLRSQTIDPLQVEYLIVDNQSLDRTPEILQEIIKKSNFPNLATLQAPEIQSAYAARNVGIKAARGEIVVFTDVDCRPQPDWLAQLIPPFQNPQVHLVMGEITGLASKNWLEIYAEQTHILSQRHTLNHEFLPYGQTANLAVRKAILREVGLFRPYLATGGDADLCWRVQHKFPNCWEFQPGAIVQHRHRSTLKEFYNQWYKYGCSNYYLHQLHGVNLRRQFSWQEYLYRCSRWLGWEIPQKLWRGKLSIDPTGWAELWATPLGLFGTWARFRGQKFSKIPPRLAEIEWL
ncbi:MAG: glycosyltransferase [Coleofasciculaceae cyanobacterium SM2_1_6]|nr:glycosyltransferase [Coleofasciculaceae cyanobacterium SM2_1_6]